MKKLLTHEEHIVKPVEFEYIGNWIVPKKEAITRGTMK